MPRDREQGIRTALVSSSFAPHVGGVEEHVARVAEQLTDQGQVVEIWAVDRGLRPTHDFDPRIRVRYLPTPLPARTAPAMASFAVRFPRALGAWRTAVREFRPDILSVQCFGPNGLYALAAHRRLGIPLLVTSHGETLGDDTDVYARSALLRRGLRRAIAAASAVIAPSDYVLADLRARFGLARDAGKIIPNGVALNVGVTDPFAPRQNLLLAVRRLGYMKGLDLLIDAFGLAALDDVQLEIIGDGPERERLQEQIRALGLSERVSLVGERDAAAVAERIGQAAAVVVPSRSESFGIVALEAWRGGAALVMTSRGGASEFMHDREDAILVDPEDTAALAEALRAVMTDSALRLSLARGGAARVSEFGWPSVGDAYHRLCRQVLTGTAP